jgi:hypothetical protein
MNGRFETRVFLTMPLYLCDPKGALPSTLALTENVSARGARIVTKLTAAAGERWLIAALTGNLRISAQVMYCEPSSNNNFCIGLQLEHPVHNWWNQSQPASNPVTMPVLPAQDTSIPLPKAIKRGKAAVSV